jgi:hypothetical protein
MGNCFTCFKSPPASSQPAVPGDLSSRQLSEGQRAIDQDVQERNGEEESCLVEILGCDWCFSFLETDELLQQSPIVTTNLSSECRSSSIKKSLGLLNSAANTVGDILTSGKLEHD